MKAAIATVGVVGMLANGAAANPTYSSLAVKDPFCAGLQTKACKDTPNCHWTSERHVHHSHDYDYDYDNWMKVSHSAKDRTSYGKNWRPEGCSLAHVFDRMEPNVNGAEKAKLNEWGLASTWDTIECGDAFIVKDCKDINQKHPNKCEWNCHSHTCIPFAVEGFEASKVPVQVAKADVSGRCSRAGKAIDVAGILSTGGCVPGFHAEEDTYSAGAKIEMCFSSDKQLRIKIDKDWDGNFAEWGASVVAASSDGRFVDLVWNNWSSTDNDEDNYSSFTAGARQDFDNLAGDPYEGVSCYMITDFHGWYQEYRRVEVVGIGRVMSNSCKRLPYYGDYTDDWAAGCQDHYCFDNDQMYYIQENLTPRHEQVKALRAAFMANVAKPKVFPAP